MPLLELTSTPETDAAGATVAVNHRAVYECRDAVLFADITDPDEVTDTDVVWLLGRVHAHAAALLPPAAFPRYPVFDTVVIKDGVFRAEIEWRDDPTPPEPSGDPDVERPPAAVIARGLTARAARDARVPA